MLKKILGIALVLAVAFFAVILPLSAIKSKRVIAGADGTTPDENYWFESIQTGIAVNRDKTFSVTERMKVGFSKAETNTGIIRDIQRVSQTTRIVDGKRKKGQPYLASLSDVKATIDGADAKITQSYYDAGQFFSVKMQKEDESFFGATDVEGDTGFHDFRLSYLYDMSDDKIGGFDDFTFDVLGYETALTKSFSVTVAFPSEIDASQVSVRTNEMEAWSPAEGEGWRVEGNTLTMNARLNEKDRGYTVQVLFPDGYFQTELTHFWYYWLFAVSVLGFIIAGLIIAVKYFPRKAVEPVEVVPPKGISLMRASALRYGEAR